MMILQSVKRGVEGFFSRASKHPLPVILMYHRVADLSVDPWALAVSPGRFADQIRALSAVRRVVRLRDLGDAIESSVPGEKPLAVVTFDDGYSDVYRTALPILQEHECPATVFLITGALDSNREFWWDALSRILLETITLPPFLSLVIAGKEQRWRIPSASRARSQVFLEVWSTFRLLGDGERKSLLKELFAWSRLHPIGRSEDRAMTSSEVIALTNGGLIEIGAHTVTHPLITSLSPEERHRELSESRSHCERLCGGCVDLFSYPHGDYNQESVDAVRASGFSVACTSRAGNVKAGTNLMELPRIQVLDWDNNKFVNELEHAS
jgi:peptidoglycan/xylan/chitin deacetylase (PgdA/CDA1 family)